MSKESPSVDISTIEDPTALKIIQYFEENGIKVVIKDFSIGDVHVYAAITYNQKLTPRHIGYNTIHAGASFNPVEALLRALTERMQGAYFEMEARMGFIDRDTPDRYLPLFFRGICPFNLGKHIDIEDTVPFNNNIPRYDGILEEINRLISLCSELDTELIVVDHTHPVINFPTVRVIMPGMSDFTLWWDPQKVVLNLLGRIDEREDRYEKKLIKVVSSFKRKPVKLSGGKGGVITGKE